MNLTHRNLAPIHCASDPCDRYGLACLHFGAAGQTVASNGHVAARVTPSNGEKHDPFEVELAELAPLQKEQRKRKPPAAWLASGLIADRAALVQRAGAPDMELPKREGSYPNVERIFPTTGKATFAISLHVLESIVATARQFTQTRKGEIASVNWTVPEGFDVNAVHVISVECEGDTLDIAAMPCRIK